MSDALAAPRVAMGEKWMEAICVALAGLVASVPGTRPAMDAIIDCWRDSLPDAEVDEVNQWLSSWLKAHGFTYSAKLASQMEIKADTPQEEPPPTTSYYDWERALPNKEFALTALYREVEEILELIAKAQRETRLAEARESGLKEHLEEMAAKIGRLREPPGEPDARK